jgi:hypothetical protein
MAQLYLETKNGPLPIEKRLAEKYELKKGTRAPFSGGRIVGENGDFTRDPADDPEGKRLSEEVKKEAERTIPDVVLTPSEIIDLAHGEDSSETI